MPEDTPSQRNALLLQWLTEAHSKEAELEADLTAHIALTQKAPYKKRLQSHLKETRDHKRQVAGRIKKLGGQPSDGPAPRACRAPSASWPARPPPWSRRKRAPSGRR